mmetsp:Transcript_13467/g.12185  ORF Transcript_13467/g.12185 Transcript_13467/m.12185 type:complete len:118 (+) Transcript_13467:59-412(+)
MDEGYDFTAPDDLKALRACMRCGLIKTVHQFADNGCENCPFLHLDRGENTQKCTSSYFEGSIAILEANGSWVAKWNGISDCIPGLYAIQIIGQLPEEALQRCEEANVVPRSSAKIKS